MRVVVAEEVEGGGLVREVLEGGGQRAEGQELLKVLSSVWVICDGNTSGNNKVWVATTRFRFDRNALRGLNATEGKMTTHPESLTNFGQEPLPPQHYRRDPEGSLNPSRKLPPRLGIHRECPFGDMESGSVPGKTHLPTS